MDKFTTLEHVKFYTSKGDYSRKVIPVLKTHWWNYCPSGCKFNGLLDFKLAYNYRLPFKLAAECQLEDDFSDFTAT